MDIGWTLGTVLVVTIIPKNHKNRPYGSQHNWTTYADGREGDYITSLFSLFTDLLINHNLFFKWQNKDVYKLKGVVHIG